MMKITRKAIIIGSIILVAIFLLANGITSANEFKQKVPLSRCFDYDFLMEFDEVNLPVEVIFYTESDSGYEYFKSDTAREIISESILHCGHDYKVVYTFNDGKSFTDYFSVPEYNPLVRKTTRIERL